MPVKRKLLHLNYYKQLPAVIIELMKKITLRILVLLNDSNRLYKAGHGSINNTIIITCNFHIKYSMPRCFGRLTLGIGRMVIIPVYQCYMISLWTPKGVNVVLDIRKLPKVSVILLRTPGDHQAINY
jgi:hypothetical protein